jgi:2-hydroxycyclohexanecarboxyl-CoA dehydrogenase
VNSPDHGRVDHGLAGRAVIVTGGTRGIGLGIATALTRAGALVTITGRSSKRLEAARVALSSLGTEPLALQRNVADRSAMLDVAALTFERFGRIDGLVNNAQSFRPVMPLADVEESDINLLFDTGPKGTLWGMQAVLPFMRAAGWGRIVNMGSSAGIRGDAGYGPYAASKEAIRALTRVAAREWAGDGVVVNCVCPASAGHRAPPDNALRAEHFAAMYRDHPMGRDGDAEADIAPVVLFLLSEASRFLNGETLMVDGGGHMRA